MTRPFNQHDLPEGPWVLEMPAPVVLVLVGVSADLTESPETLAASVAGAIGADVDVSIPDDIPEGVAWLASLHIEGLPMPLLCWPEPAAASGTGLPDAIAERPGLVVQSLLHPGDPLTCFANMLRLLTMLDPTAAGVLDADTGRWLERALLEEEILHSDIEPRDDLLWIVEVTSDDESHSLQTSGLARCGRREMRIDAIESSLVDSAADLLASTASLVLETPLPECGSHIEIGPGLHLLIAGDVDQEDVPLQLEAERGGEPPRDVLRRLCDGAAAVYRSERATDRHRAIAVHTWSEFLELYDRLIAAGAECFVEVPWEDASGDETVREHLWMTITSCVNDGVMAAPAHDGSLVRGIPTKPTQVTRDEICSWRVILTESSWGPEQLHLLVAHLDAGCPS
ncbi:MAG: hypothetical protein QGG74_03000 [Phycisphaerales bacterium]|jgi:uncharacterized protein YegJ (DUF2314 family)|nr:hypothetical protein [Phycisphaerales bacterium]